MPALLIILIALCTAAPAEAADLSATNALSATATPTPTATVTPTLYAPRPPAPVRSLLEGLGIEDAEDGLQPYDVEIVTTTSPIEIEFQDMWDMGRSGLTLYSLIERLNDWGALLGILVVSFAVSLVFRVLSRPPDV